MNQSKETIHMTKVTCIYDLNVTEFHLGLGSQNLLTWLIWN